jgi:hypothetical protein
VADAVNMIKPEIVYTYHYGDTDVNRLKEFLKDKKDVELRIRDYSSYHTFRRLQITFSQ